MEQPTPKQRPINQPSIGIVLLGVGVRSIAVVPLFDFLEEENIAIDLIIGSSSASRICAQVGLGFSTEQMIENQRALLRLNPFSKMDYGTLLNLVHPRLSKFDRSSGAIRKKPLFNFYKQLFGKYRLEDLSPTTILQATDLETEDPISLTAGPLAEAVYASSAFFPFVPPIELNDKLLVDGSLTMPLPIMEAIKRDIDIIITVMVAEEFPLGPTKTMDAFTHSINLMGLANIRSQMAFAIDMHHFEIIPIYIKCKRFISPGKMAQVDELIHWGQEAIAAKKDEIKTTISHFQKL